MASAAIAAPSAGEMSALGDGVALAARPGDRLDLAGADRERFLHNLVTCEVRGLSAGSSVRGFVTHLKGGVLADADVVALGDRYRLVLPAGRGGAIREHLEQHRITERVEIERRDDLAALALRGARAPELLAALGVESPAMGERVESEIGGAPVGVRREPRGREPRYELEVAAADRDGLVAALWRAGESLGLLEISAAAVELARVEDGELAWGVDYGEENFPQETGEETAVSYTKGCYLGQEVVARIHYRGGVQRLACRLRFAPGEAPPAGAELFHEGRTAGRATTVVQDPRSAGRVGLGLVHRRALAAGAAVALAGGGRVELEPLGES